MELGLGRKVAIVTGGSKGIGRATAIGLVAEGASVLVCARGKEALDEVVAAVGAASRERIAAIAADLTDGASINRVVAHCVEQFGRVDILINNAGSARPGEFLKLDDQAWIDDWQRRGFIALAPSSASAFVK
jgi:3-oxoacyl-[acyl-carrier protein] reductase